MRNVIERNMDRHGPALYGCRRGSGRRAERLGRCTICGPRGTKAGHMERPSIRRRTGL